MDHIVSDNTVDVSHVAHFWIWIVRINPVGSAPYQTKSNAAGAVDDDVVLNQRVPRSTSEVDCVFGQTTVIAVFALKRVVAHLQAVG